MTAQHLEVASISVTQVDQRLLHLERFDGVLEVPVTLLFVRIVRVRQRV